MKIRTVLLRGVYTIDHMRGGELLSREMIGNTITTAGIKVVAGLINEVDSGGFKWLALDASSTVALASDTALATEITSDSLGRASGTATRVTTSLSSDTAQLLSTFNSTATQTVYGVGAFDTSTASAGNMIARTTFTAKNLISGDTLQITHKVKVA